MNFLKNLKNRITDPLVANVKNILVPDEILEQRRSICDSCEHKLKRYEQCDICGCYIPLKTKFAYFACPIKKWNSINIVSVNKE